METEAKGPNVMPDSEPPPKGPNKGQQVGDGNKHRRDGAYTPTPGGPGVPDRPRPTPDSPPPKTKK